MHEDMDFACRGVYILIKKLYFDDDEDYLLDDSEEIFIMDTKISL